MQTSSQTAPVSRKKLWAGRVISGLPVVFLLVDSIMKIFKPPVVVKATLNWDTRRL